MINKVRNVEYFVNDKLYSELEKIKLTEMKRKDNNKIILVCGGTGDGKSAFSFQCSGVLDPNFWLDNITFTNDQTQTAIKALHNKVINFDEAFRGASSRNTMNKQQKQLLEMLYEIRQLNQVIFLNSPSFFRLDEAIAVELSDALFYIYKLKNGRRAFKMFNKKKKNKLYYLAKKKGKSYNHVYTSINGYFPKTYVVPEIAYRKKKFDSLFGEKKVDFKEDREARLWKTIHSLTGTYKKAAEAVKPFGIDIKKNTISEKVANMS